MVFDLEPGKLLIFRKQRCMTNVVQRAVYNFIYETTTNTTKFNCNTWRSRIFDFLARQDLFCGVLWRQNQDTSLRTFLQQIFIHNFWLDWHNNYQIFHREVRYFHNIVWIMDFIRIVFLFVLITLLVDGATRPQKVLKRSKRNHVNCRPNSLVRYRMTVETFWSKQTFPKMFPTYRPHAQWSVLVGKYNLHYLRIECVHVPCRIYV